MSNDWHLPRWALINIALNEIADGYIITAYTNVPCHLFCRMSLQEPWTHKIPVYRRGAIFRTDVRFCFTVYEDNEQSEPGDTLVHTFYKHSWPVCQTRWWYFYGTVGGQLSPSETAIFTKHHTPPPYLDLFPDGIGAETFIPTEWPRGSLHWQDVAMPVSQGAYFVQHNLGAYWARDLYHVNTLPLAPYTKLRSVQLWAYNVADSNLKEMKFALYKPGSAVWESESFPMHNYGNLNPPTDPLPTTKALDMNPVTNLPWQTSDFDDLQLGTVLLNQGIVGSGTTYHEFIRIIDPRVF